MKIKRICVMTFLIVIVILAPLQVNANVEVVEEMRIAYQDKGGGISTGLTSSYWDPKSESKSSSRLDSKVNYILGIIQAIGTFIAVGAIMVIGMKTMIGSMEEKSKYKEALPGYIFGVVMVFAITWLPALIYNLMKDFK